MFPDAQRFLGEFAAYETISCGFVRSDFAQGLFGASGFIEKQAIQEGVGMQYKGLSVARIIALLLMISACSPSEAQIATAIAQTELARPTATATPEPTATSTPTPTFTPTQTSTPTTEPTPTFLYDTFDNTAHNGYINQALWVVHANSNMAIIQNNGMLAFQASRPNNSGALWINPTSGVEASVQNYNFIEATFSWESNIRNRVFFGITVLQNWSPRRVYSCDFILAEVLPILHCSGIDGQQTVSPEDISVVTGRAYELRIEINPTTAAFVIYLDDTVIDTYQPPSPERWLQGRVAYDIHFEADPGSIATGYVDDVRFGTLE